MSLQPETLEFDSRGDLILLLERTDEVLATGVPVDQTPAGYALTDDLPIDEAINAEPAIDEAPIVEAPIDEAPTILAPTDETLGDVFSIDHGAAVEASEHVDETSPSLSVTTVRREVKLRVSSKHLALASKVFQDMFDSTYSKDLSSGDEDMVTIPLRNDDFDGMQILLNIIHGSTRSVPRQLDLKTFLQTVVLIDKYEFEEVAEVFTDMWFASLRPKMSQGLDADLGSWIFICEVLNKEHEYKSLTKIAILETNYGLVDKGGRVPDRTIRGIQRRRHDVLTEALLTITQLLDSYSGSRRLCPQIADCDALAVGKLMRGLKSTGLYPIPDPSTIKRSTKDVFSALRSIDLSPLCRSLGKKGRHYYRSYDVNEFYPEDGDEVYHHMDEVLEEKLSSLEARVQGMTL